PAWDGLRGRGMECKNDESSPQELTLHVALRWQSFAETAGGPPVAACQRSAGAPYYGGSRNRGTGAGGLADLPPPLPQRGEGGTAVRRIAPRLCSRKKSAGTSRGPWSRSLSCRVVLGSSPCCCWRRECSAPKRRRSGCCPPAP